MDEKPWMWLLGGCNGSGKSTFASEYLPKIVGSDIPFVNADDLARELGAIPGKSKERVAGEQVLRMIDGYINNQQSFVVETTLSGRTYDSRVDRVHADGWNVGLIYMAVSDPKLARKRVEMRVAAGGHDVEEHIISRRWVRGLSRLADYVTKMDRLFVFTNQESTVAPVLIADGLSGHITLHNPIILPSITVRLLAGVPEDQLHNWMDRLTEEQDRLSETISNAHDHISSYFLHFNNLEGLLERFRQELELRNNA